ncbi:MAG TPA: protein-disulfide reductase DsbD N-terminal domain-containing protein, partial [Candidatus Acidoferrum sp.]|nr:protein-disulfide reductase DsbD N-terminal domain-containing protein [Candidatus Acidoferrum sp.]
MFAIAAFAQDQHVTWTLTTEPAAASPGGTVLVRMAGKIEEGWHLYSMSSPAATPTKVQLTGPAVEKVRALQPAPKRSFDPNFNSDTEFYEGDVTFLFDVQLKKDAPPGPAELAVSAKYQTCNPKMCVPSKWSGATTVKVDPAAAAVAPAIPAGYSEPVVPVTKDSGPNPPPDSLAG